jgi:GT2 family glycosyltransferase
MNDIAVIIVNWNTFDDTRICLEHIYALPKPKCDIGVWVIDNASTGDDADRIQATFPQVNLIRNPDNRGFSKANNQGINEAVEKGYRYIHLINSDAYIHSPDMFDKIVEFGDNRQDVGIFGTKVLNPDGTLQFSCRRFPTLGAGVFRNTLLGRLFPNNKYAKDYLMGDIDHDKERKVDWVSGCSMVLRGELIEKLGAFDEQFFMYCEDLDLCRRATDYGSNVWFFPEAVVTHKIGASSDKSAEKMIWEFHKSWLQYVDKHYPNQPIRHYLVKCGLWLRAYIRIMNRRRRGSKS